MEKPWDIKLKNGMNITENRLYKMMCDIGLDPKPQYIISDMTVDFAFPDKKLVVEINGPNHDSEESKIIDRKRHFVLRRLGWRRRSYDASLAYNTPMEVAYRIKKVLESVQKEQDYPNEQIIIQSPKSKKKHKHLLIKIVLILLIYISLVNILENYLIFGFILLTFSLISLYFVVKKSKK